MCSMTQSLETGTIEAARQGASWAEAAIADAIRAFAQAISRGRGPMASASIDWEDVAQEASRRFFSRGMDQYRATGSEKGYLYTIVKATWIQLARSASRRRKREEIANPIPSSPRDPNPRLELLDVLRRLDSTCQELLERVFFDGASYADLADELGLAESSVRSRITRCIQKARAIA
jgi:RNA polymerase sigma factor (sigma-70 family)